MDTDEDFFGATGIPHPLANMVCRSHWRAELTAEQIDARVTATINWFAARQAPFLWYVWPSTQPESLVNRLDAAGLMRHDGGPAMTLDLMALSADAAPAGLRVSVVEDEEAYARWGDVLSAAMEFDAGTRMAMSKLLPLLGYSAPQRQYLGVVDSEPVATATLLVAGKIALLIKIGTLTHMRGRVIGAAIISAALRDARQAGCEIAALTSSEMGYPIYQKLGFVERFRLPQYIWAPGLSNA